MTIDASAANDYTDLCGFATFETSSLLATLQARIRSEQSPPAIALTMSQDFLIGVFPNSTDPFWVQVEEAVRQQARQLPVELVTISADGLTDPPTPERQLSLIEELLALELNALVGWWFPEAMAIPVLDAGLPIIHLSETEVNHPLSVSPRGLYDVGRMAAEYLAQCLGGHGRVLVVGGLMRPHFQDDGRSRLAGIRSVLAAHPELEMVHLPSNWGATAADDIEQGLQRLCRPFAGVIGLSDPLALQAYAIGRALELVESDAVLVGVNGDPLALSAIARGEMSATVETDPGALGAQAAELALRAARRESLPVHYPFRFQLVTAGNVAETAARRLLTTATLPNRLVGVTPGDERLRMIQLETSLDISRAIGFTRDPRQLAQQIADLIRNRYAFDAAYILRWREDSQTLVYDYTDAPDIPSPLPGEPTGVLRQALFANEVIYIPNTQRSLRFAPDPAWPQTRTRAVAPIRVGDRIYGLLDLHGIAASPHLGREKLVGLQSLADQLGGAIHNAKLYQEALHLRRKAEEASQLKAQLLANITHELGGPLVAIVDRSLALLGQTDGATETAKEAPVQTIQAIHDAAAHLLRLINENLELSQAEAEHLSLAFQLVNPCAFLARVFDRYASGRPDTPPVEWRLHLPERLPFVSVDAQRAEQIIAHLLENACARTRQGVIALGAEIAPPHLHIWVSDSGGTIPNDEQGRLFIPLSKGDHEAVTAGTRGFSAWSGLAIAHRLTLLHQGSLTVESGPGQGAAFHVFLPLPSLAGQATSAAGRSHVALLFGVDDTPAPDLAAFFQRAGLTWRRGLPAPEAGQKTEPSLIVWDKVPVGMDDWGVIVALGNDARLRQLPFLLFPPAPDGDESRVGNAAETLIAALAARCSPRATGPLLVVDADPESRSFLRRLVEHHTPFCVAHIVGDADAGLSLLDRQERQPPGLIILDLDLPNGAAYSLLHTIRSTWRTQQSPVLAFTTDGLTHAQVELLQGYPALTLYHKGILTAQETASALQGALFRAEATPCHTSALVKHAVYLVQQRYGEPISRADFANAIGVSESYLSQIFRQELGVSLWEYLNRYRILKAKAMLRRTVQSMTEIAGAVGIDDSSYFSRLFRKQVGMSPSAYRIAPHADGVPLS